MNSKRLSGDSDLTFDTYLDRWGLVPDGAAFATRVSRLMPVRRGGVPAMLKLSTQAEERRGHVLMRWWDGDGAARVLAFDETALLLERATGTMSLADMARDGRDDEASRILCAVAARLHAPRGEPLPALIPLAIRFRALEPAAATHGGILLRCAAAARDLLADPRDIGPLHGDLHHENVLDFGKRGWHAIDPKSLVGERGFDFATLFSNPDLCAAVPPVVLAPGRLERRVEVVAAAAALEPRRLSQWVLAGAGLSAAWFLGDGVSPEITLQVAEQAAAALDR